MNWKRLRYKLKSIMIAIHTGIDLIFSDNSDGSLPEFGPTPMEKIQEVAQTNYSNEQVAEKRPPITPIKILQRLLLDLGITIGTKYELRKLLEYGLLEELMKPNKGRKYSLAFSELYTPVPDNPAEVSKESLCDKLKTLYPETYIPSFEDLKPGRGTYTHNLQLSNEERTVLPLRLNPGPIAKLGYKEDGPKTIFSSKEDICYSQPTISYFGEAKKHQYLIASDTDYLFAIRVLLTGKRKHKKQLSVTPGKQDKKMTEILRGNQDLRNRLDSMFKEIPKRERFSTSGALTYIRELIYLKPIILEELSKRKTELDAFFTTLEEKLGKLKEYRKLTDLAVVTESSCLPENWINDINCRSCTLGPGGKYKTVAINYELDKNIGILRLVGTFLNHNPLGFEKENIGIAYIFQCKDEQNKLSWLVDGVDSGIEKYQIKDDWREIFYKGIIAAAKKIRSGIRPKKIYFNQHVNNENNEKFNKYIQTKGIRKKIQLTKNEQLPKKYSKKKKEKTGLDQYLLFGFPKYDFGGNKIKGDLPKQKKYYMETFHKDEIPGSVWNYGKGLADVVEVDLGEEK